MQKFDLSIHGQRNLNSNDTSTNPDHDKGPKYSFMTYSPRDQPHLGMLLVMHPEEEEWKLVCRIGIGRTELETVCRSMGFKTGYIMDEYVGAFYDYSANKR